MERYNWSRLNALQVGRFAEYFAKMEFALYGYEVFTSEVDDRGIDFIIRKDGRFCEVQVKSIRGFNYVFFPKDKFPASRLAAVVVLHEGQSPEFY
ncbi:MAG: hypothetical protein WBD31_16710 [Rubripirellula sp.]